MRLSQSTSVTTSVSFKSTTTSCYVTVAPITGACNKRRKRDVIDDSAITMVDVEVDEDFVISPSEVEEKERDDVVRCRSV